MAFRSAFCPLWCLVAVVTISPCLGLHNGVTRYQHFEDYLRNMDSDQQAIITDDAPPDGDSGSPAERSITTTPSTTTSWENQRDITCCMLGQIAGDKGYHCFAKFYAARLRMRNRNRAHNRKMGFYGRNRIPDYGHRVMRTFEQCVVGDHGVLFHKCCHRVALERRDRVRYDTYAAAASSPRQPQSSASEQGEPSASEQSEREHNRYHVHHHRQHRTQEEASAGGESLEATTTTTERPNYQPIHRHRDSDGGNGADAASRR